MLDTKLKNSRKIRIILAIVVILAVTAGNMFLFPQIAASAEKKCESNPYEYEEYSDVDYESIQALYRGTYVLYYEHFTEQKDYPQSLWMVVNNWGNEFESYRNIIDYYAQAESGDTKNSAQSVEKLLYAATLKDNELEQLRNLYQCYFTIAYDENGNMSVEDIWSQGKFEDTILKTILQAARNSNFETAVLEQYDEYQATEYLADAGNDNYIPHNFEVVYAIPSDIMIMGETTHLQYWNRMGVYASSGSGSLFIGSLAVLLVVLLLLTSKKIWKGSIDYCRRRHQYFMEISIIGVIFVYLLFDAFISLNITYADIFQSRNMLEVLAAGSPYQITEILGFFGETLLLYLIWYLSCLYIRPVFSLGIREYIRQYSAIYGIFRLCFGKIKREVSQVDFSDKTIRTIGKLVIINFLALAVISCFWFFGVFLLVIYSIGLFFWLKKYYQRIQGNYHSLMQAVSRIAQGDLQYEDKTNWGVFEPFKSEMSKIRQSFSKAVEEEVKSQRMKAELITNVSHDLKTPLTAITTYVELLKDESITPKQQQEYIEVLEKKSLRLKVLVEDLFEVSKATSNTINLDLMEVDVVNLLKQVAVEHEDKFAKRKLFIKWNLPEEKVVHMLDNQKTWRIFENLFVNIEKYAMEGSRVYIEVTNENGVEVILRNMSAEELRISGGEITERFVRGDFARATEGSGLGLAIAKSFTEAQKGEFHVTIDGDLFKVAICWK